MKLARLACVVVMLVPMVGATVPVHALAPAAQAATAKAKDIHDGPWLGTWKRRSTDPNAPTYVMKVVRQGDGLKYTIDVSGGTEKPRRMEAAFKLDGKPYAETGNPSADQNTFTRIDDHTLDLIESKEGKEVARIKISFSPDGKVRTSVTTRKNEKGEPVTTTSYWDRVE